MIYRYDEYTLASYLRYEEFWTMYLEGEVDLDALKEWKDSHSNGELHEKFLQMREEFSKRDKAEDGVNLDVLRQQWQDSYHYKELSDELLEDREKND